MIFGPSASRPAAWLRWPRDAGAVRKEPRPIANPGGEPMGKFKGIGLFAALATTLLACSDMVAAAPVVMRASHQFPGGKGDVRDDMVQMIAREAKAANVDLDIQ